jgi:hypothetical protein
VGADEALERSRGGAARRSAAGSWRVGQAAPIDGVAGVQVGGAGIELELRHPGPAAGIG